MIGIIWAVLAVQAPQIAQVRSGDERGAASVELPGLELVYTFPSPTTPSMAEVTGAVGVYPRGIGVGDQITIYADGRLSRPLCRAAAGALAPLLQSMSEGRDFEAEASCECPLVNSWLTFAPRTTASVGANQRVTSAIS